MTHCCDMMGFHIYKREKIIRYDAPTRTYGIKATKTVRQRIDFCPWCGVKLPSDLSDELVRIMFDELDLTGFDDPRMPQELKTDEWWKKRGL